MINLIISGEPVAKGRPRFTRRGNFITTYTPEKTVNYETLVKSSFQEKYPNFKPLQDTLRMDIIAYFSAPKSTSKKKHADMIAGIIRPTKMDCDNIAKIILDSLNKIAYNDDRQVAELLVIKKFSDLPRVEIKIKSIEMTESEE